MKPIFFLLTLTITLFFSSCAEELKQVSITTEYGEIVVELYNTTPKHRDNFLKLIDQAYYDGTLMHRVVKGFIIQGGDPDSKKAQPQSLLGKGGPGYTIPGEFKEYHTKGALAAARQKDALNPDKESSGSQFYFVHGNSVDEATLSNLENSKDIKYTDKQKQDYLKNGGTPQLDGEYTVFGHVISGIEVIDKIAEVERGVADRPLKDIKVTSVKRIK
ncbi:MAG: peptidylprolyl isomerase [Saprospiraceae bacterium]|nr:peptidylprolyl isomerase [Saprospiraceae bacterium]MBP6693843.1 peptidylprolyl isomerase [Saprospiraceae bacterium]